MYNVEFLSIANRDIVDTLKYISTVLNNKSGANALLDKIQKAIELISEFPYGSPVYNPIRPLEKEYRKILVGNYIMFYYVEENIKTVTVARFIYSGRNIENMI